MRIQKSVEVFYCVWCKHREAQHFTCNSCQRYMCDTNALDSKQCCNHPAVCGKVMFQLLCQTTLTTPKH